MAAVSGQGLAEIGLRGRLIMYEICALAELSRRDRLNGLRAAASSEMGN